MASLVKIKTFNDSILHHIILHSAKILGTAIIQFWVKDKAGKCGGNIPANNTSKLLQDNIQPTQAWFACPFTKQTPKKMTYNAQ